MGGEGFGGEGLELWEGWVLVRRLDGREGWVGLLGRRWLGYAVVVDPQAADVRARLGLQEEVRWPLWCRRGDGWVEVLVGMGRIRLRGTSGW